MTNAKAMDWEKLISFERFHPVESKSDENRSDFHRDYDRIVFSAAFRRLGRKTQVHPLSVNDNTHTRLTHSIETGSVGRGLGFVIGEWLQKEKLLPEEINGKKINGHDIGSIVHAASVAHDIGNPPFGHAGEYALRHWYENNEEKIKNNVQPYEWSDLKLFEGNAQGFRVITQLENYSFKGGLRLTYSTLASTIKYPWMSNHNNAKTKNKFNIFQEEKSIFERIAKSTGLINKSPGCYARHPLSYLMEAADDICYKIVDIEDALVLKLVRLKDIKESILKMGNKVEEISLTKDRKEIISLRTLAINNLISKCAEIFKDNYTEIMNGTFENDLISKLNIPELDGLEQVNEITKNRVFNDTRKVELEIGSHGSISIIMDSLTDAINQFKCNPETMTFKSKSLLKLLEGKPKEDDSHYKCYMAINDYVSGMTDNYATYISGQISGQAK